MVSITKQNGTVRGLSHHAIDFESVDFSLKRHNGPPFAPTIAAH
jgi:hypothetical protein